MNAGAIVKSVLSGSPSQRAGVRAGDVIRRIAGKPVLDVLDYLYLTAAPRFRMDMEREGAALALTLSRDDADEPLGIELEDELVDGIRRCRAKCDFCFLDQMPKGYRPSLYIKDDDYRLSFLHGNFVTLTNLDARDWNKIRDMHLTPMNISVHATNPQVRRQILKNPQSMRILDDMRRLASWGIQMHTQIVVQPGLNDGAELDRSIRDIRAFHPHVETLSVVPVGLTKWRDKCAEVTEVTPHLARQIVRQVGAYQRQFQAELGYPFVYLSDEFYLLIEQPFPANHHYGDYPQLENGVGLCRLLITEFNRRRRFLPDSLPHKRRVVVATGTSGSKVLPPLIARLNQIRNLQVEMVTVPNDFLGHSVTVAGLLGGRDILGALRRHMPADAALIPSVSLREGDGVFLDDFRLEALQSALPCPVTPVDARGGDFIAAVLGRPVTSVRCAA